jgi:hypothetical protein
MSGCIDVSSCAALDQVAGAAASHTRRHQMTHAHQIPAHTRELINQVHLVDASDFHLPDQANGFAQPKVSSICLRGR